MHVKVRSELEQQIFLLDQTNFGPNHRKNQWTKSWFGPLRKKQVSLMPTLMSIGFSVLFHSIPLRFILDIKMMIEKHTWTLNFFLWCLSVSPFHSIPLRFILEIKIMIEKHTLTLKLFLWYLSVFLFGSILFRWDSFWRSRWL